MHFHIDISPLCPFRRADLIGVFRMAFDVYQPCPFCTDKKLKFCCADIAEDMEKVSRLSENGQHRAAMKILDKLAATHPDTVWNEATRAMLLLGEGQARESQAVLEKLHAAAPENQAVIALLATAAFNAVGYEAAREAIWRAFRKAIGYADIVSSLAMGIAAEMAQRGKYLAARQHLALAMRIAPPDDKQAIFVRLLEFDGDSSIPYPLRSVHSLRELDGDSERQDAARKAIRLAERGCFGPAAERFVHLAQQTPDNAAIEYNIALCTAWAGDEEVAAEAFGRAALAEQDFELATEYAALEQLLRLNFDDRRVSMQVIEYRVDSVSRLSSTFDDESRAVRLMLPPEAAGTGHAPESDFELADRPVPDSLDGESPDDVPRAIGRLAIFGSLRDGEAPFALLTAYEGEDFDAAKKLVAEVAPELETVEERVDGEFSSLPRDFLPMMRRLSFSQKTPLRKRRTIERKRWEKLVEAWLETPQEALIGKSPLEAASDDGLRVPLGGAVYVLDAVALRDRRGVDINSLRRRLELPEVAPIEGRPDLPLNTFSAIQLHRLTPTELEDRQLSVVVNRALLVHHGRFLKGVLEEALKRSLPEFDRDRLCMTMAELARETNDTDTALRWIEDGRQAARSGEQAFENVFRWDTVELALRLEDPADPDLQPFLRRMASYYGPKIPQYNEYLGALLKAAGVDAPSVIEPVGTAAGGDLWTPGQTTGDPEKKLWLPGT